MWVSNERSGKPEIVLLTSYMIQSSTYHTYSEKIPYQRSK